MSNTRLALLKDHIDAVTFGTFCKDDAYLFTASLDKKINMYNTYNWHRVYRFKADFEVDFIEFSQDETYLVAFKSYQVLG